jgi:hypothetical protein
MVQEMKCTATLEEVALTFTSAALQKVLLWSLIRTFSSVTVPPVTWIVLFVASVNCSSTPHSPSAPPSVTLLNEQNSPPDSFRMPPFIVKDFDAVTFTMEVYKEFVK